MWIRTGSVEFSIHMVRTGSVEFSIHMVFKKEAYSQRVPFSNKCLKSQSQIHTGSFAQNSFQIDSINSCSTSKKLLF